MKKPSFKPLAPKADTRRPELVRMPAPTRNMGLSDIRNGVNQDTLKQFCNDSLGVGLLLGIAQIARVFMRQKPQTNIGRNINAKKQLNPSTSYRPS